MTATELTTPQSTEPVKTRRERPRVMGAGKQLHAGPLTYVVLSLFALLSLATLKLR